MNILIIEDEQMLRRALIYNLIEAGHMVAACSNGQEGISRVEKNPHLDVIICDVMMPVLSGPGFILMLKKYYQKKMPRIIVISVVKEGEDFLHKIDIHYDYYLPKPVDFTQLEELLAKIENEVVPASA